MTAEGDRREVRQQVSSGKGSVNTLAAGDVHQTINVSTAKWAGAIVAAAVLVFAGVYYSTGDADVSDAFAGGAPLHVTVQTREFAQNNNGAWFLPGRLLNAGQTLDSDQLSTIMSKRSDTVDTYETSTLVTVEGNRSHTVDITGMRIKILSKAAPAAGGTLLVYPSQGEDTNIKIGFNLDEPIPVARNADPEEKGYGARFFDSHSVSVKKGEIVNLGFTFVTVKWDVSYDLVLEEVVDGKTFEQPVTNGAVPFHTRGYALAYDQAVAPDNQAGAWAVTSREKAMDAMCGTPCTTGLTPAPSTSAK